MPVLRSILLFSAFSVTCFALSAAPAEAVRVKNRDTIAHQLSVSTSPGDLRVVELQPGEAFSTYSPYVTLRLLDGAPRSEQRARYLDEYVIWPGGTLLIQKRRWLRHKAF